MQLNCTSKAIIDGKIKDKSLDVQREANERRDAVAREGNHMKHEQAKSAVQSREGKQAETRV